MFSAPRNSLRAPPNPSSESAEVEQQILSELAAAAAKPAMVATRSQEHLGDFSPDEIPKADTTKKRRLSELDQDLPDETVSKRRAETPADNPTSWINGRDRALIPTVSPSINNTNIPKDGIEVRIINGGKSRSVPLKSAAESDSAGRTHTRQRENGHITRKRPVNPTKHNTAEEFLYPASSIELSERPDNKRLSPASIKAKHKRFSSVEIQGGDSLPLDDGIAAFDKIAPPVEVQTGIESEDEGPEAISTSKGLSEARSAANEAARVAGRYVIALGTRCYLMDQYLTCSRQKLQEKQRRRDRDARLKFQAKLARPSKRKLQGSTAETDSLLSPSTLIGSFNDPNADSEARSKASKESRLPMLLPEEILSTEPMVRPPTPPPQSFGRERRLVKKRRLLDIDSKPPKDIRHGSLIIRVLDSGPGNMPPKASKESRMVREAWLTGQRGPKGGIERRKSGGGFVRRV